MQVTPQAEAAQSPASADEIPLSGDDKMSNGTIPLNNVVTHEEKCLDERPAVKSLAPNELSSRTHSSSSSSSKSAVAAPISELRSKNSSKINPKMLILDFKERNESNLLQIQRVLTRETNIRAFTMRMLSRNGISILFRNERAKMFAEEILLKELDALLLKRKPKESYISTKSTFQVAAILPIDIQPEAIAKRIKASKFITRGFNKFIFFLNTIEEAKLLIENGLIIDESFVNFFPFVFNPRIICRDCGSLEHKSCNISRCLNCAGTHETDDCDAMDTVYCCYCRSKEHNPDECSVYKEKLSKAKANKKKSYAEALKGSSLNQSIKKKAKWADQQEKNAGSHESSRSLHKDGLKVNGSFVDKGIIMLLLDAFSRFFKLECADLEIIYNYMNEVLKPSHYEKAIIKKSHLPKRNDLQESLTLDTTSNISSSRSSKRQASKSKRSNSNDCSDDDE
jgi:hypothetical protein